jgi:ribosomal RNA-processing protein 36
MMSERSSDRDDSDQSDSSSGHQSIERKSPANTRFQNRLAETAGSESSSSDDNSDESDDSESGAESRDGDQEEAIDSLPLAERLRRMEEEGVDLRVVRERKQKARNKRSHEALDKNKAFETSESSAKRSKHAPTVASSKRADFYNRQPTITGVGVDIGAHKYKARDPRLSNLSGTFDQKHFDRNYAFLNEYRAQEIQQLKQKIAASKVSGRKGQHLRKKLGVINSEESLEADKLRLKSLQQEAAEFERQQINRAAKEAVQKKLVDKDGRHYHVKRSTTKKLELEARFEEIKKRGGTRAVNKVLAKKRKKNKSRDAAKMGRVERATGRR